MKGWTIVCSLLVAVAAVSLRAADRRVNYFGQLEYLTYSDAFEKNEKKFRDDLLEAYGSDGIVSGSNDTKGGAGARIGAMATTPVDGLTIGGSLGYIMGPMFKGKMIVPITMLDDMANDLGEHLVALKVKDESNIWRLMAESKYSVPIGEKFQARLGFGIGIAKLHVEENFSDEFVGGGGTLSSEYRAINTTKITWEIGPAIAMVTKKMAFELSLTYSQMPTAKDSLSFQKFNWNPLAIRLGVDF